MKIAKLLQQLLSRGITGIQKQLVKAFDDIGVRTTQSSVSRALKKSMTLNQLITGVIAFIHFELHPKGRRWGVS